MDDEGQRKAMLGRDMLARATGSPAQEFGSFFLSRLLGFSIAYEGDACILTFEAVSPLFNPQGTLHGGILATAMDTSMGHLLHRAEAAGATLEMKVQFLAPVKSGTVRCEGRFIRKGRSISFLQSHAYRADGKLAAYATATWTLPKRD
jgi:uncharacterized protein (TIGR00369 family)